MDNMVGPPTLTWLSASIPDFSQSKRNVTISDMDTSRCDLEPKEPEVDIDIDKTEVPCVKLQPM